MKNYKITYTTFLPQEPFQPCLTGKVLETHGFLGTPENAIKIAHQTHTTRFRGEHKWYIEKDKTIPPTLFIGEMTPQYQWPCQPILQDELCHYEIIEHHPSKEACEHILTQQTRSGKIFNYDDGKDEFKTIVNDLYMHGRLIAFGSQSPDMTVEELIYEYTLPGGHHVENIVGKETVSTRHTDIFAKNFPNKITIYTFYPDEEKIKKYGKWMRDLQQKEIKKLDPLLDRLEHTGSTLHKMTINQYHNQHLHEFRPGWHNDPFFVG